MAGDNTGASVVDERDTGGGGGGGESLLESQSLSERVLGGAAALEAKERFFRGFLGILVFRGEGVVVEVVGLDWSVLREGVRGRRMSVEWEVGGSDSGKRETQ